MNDEPLSWTDIDLIKRHPSIMTRAGAALLVIDMQEKLLNTIKDRYDLLQRTELLIEAAKVLSVPVLLTEQYPKGLGGTHKQLEPYLEHVQTFEKCSFSAAGEESFLSTLKSMDLRHIAIAGIETHVCVCQTALDLKVRGYEVSVCADAVSSRNTRDRDVAIERMKNAGVIITTVEALIFELLEKSGGAEFKAILKLIK